MRKRRMGFAGALAIALGVLGRAAYGDVVPAMSCELDTTTQSVFTCANQTISGNTAGGTSSATLSLAANPHLNATATSLFDGQSSRVDATMYFEVVGPAAQNVPILVNATASLMVSDPSQADASAELSLRDQSDSLAVCSGTDLYQDCVDILNSFPINRDVLVPANQILQLHLSVRANASSDGEIKATANATLDSTSLSIDWANFQTSGSYSLVVGSQFPAATVPEPAGLGWIGAGILGVVVLGYRIGKRRV